MTLIMFDKKGRRRWPLGATDPYTNPEPRHPMFRDHRCWKCNDGEKPCAQSRPGICEYPHARND